MTDTDLALVLINCESRAEAERIGRALVQERLAAAVNILDGVVSVYRWQGKTVETTESLIIAKTRAARVAALRTRVEALHGYACPSILAFVVEDAPAAYRDWLLAATAGGEEP